MTIVELFSFMIHIILSHLFPQKDYIFSVNSVIARNTKHKKKQKKLVSILES